MPDINVQDAVVAIRSALAPFANAAKVLDVLEQFASVDNWRKEALAAKDKALAEAAEADKKAAETAAWCKKARQDAQDAAVKFLGESRTRAAAEEASLLAEVESVRVQNQALAESAAKDLDALEAKIAGLRDEVAALTDSRDTISGEIIALRAKFGA